jgi:hypothetical protein
MTEQKKTASDDDGEWVDFSSDVRGFWDHEGVIKFVPTGYKSFPSRKFKNKMTTIIVGKALAPISGEDEKNQGITIGAGDLVGIWYSPGMKELTSLYGSKVKMFRDGEKDVGQAQPMKVYRIQTQKGVKPAPLPNLTVKGFTPSPTPGTASDSHDLPSDEIPF